MALYPFRGGKDSCVLSDIFDKALPNNQIPRLFVNTGIEYASVLKSVREKAKVDSRIIIINSGVNVRDMLKNKGFPFKSKDYSEKMFTFRHSGITPRLKRFLTNEKFGCPKKLRYQWILNFNLNISDKCCNELKKSQLLHTKKKAEKP